MPIIFENYRRERRARRAWSVIAAVVIAALSAIIVLSYQGRTTGPALPHGKPASTSVASVKGDVSHPEQTDTKRHDDGAERASTTMKDGCKVVDGDTLRCGQERVRLIGIDAPELPGHCRLGRHCVAGDPFAATDALRRRIAVGEVKIERMGFDRYGRTLAIVYISGRNVACGLISEHHAEYVERWDNGGRVAADCNVTL